ncbi:hypothetical protein CA54_42800 [Symmachiella macrocystis]|uniref:Uncharacterized protein n=1 Tax=Symmachiella macrocystis TaxID=2527985 RepID=A0A5C6BAL8_9PLAN|nr:hypothetical protein CA54_42800 [Symmachiella macrocystis]
MRCAALFVTALLLCGITVVGFAFDSSAVMAAISAWVVLVGTAGIITVLWKRRPQPVPVKSRKRLDVPRRVR